MYSYQHGIVEKIKEKRAGYTEILVKRNDGTLSLAINYDHLTGPANIGDPVIVNTTAVDLNLGTGGYDFVISNLNNKRQDLTGAGHIMKLRYTPYQFKVLSVEEEASPYHHLLKEKNSLEGAVVIIATLHSMLAPIAFSLNGAGDRGLKVVYIMTDGAALPIALSKSVRELLINNLIQGTITAGNAFGGDLEAINIYSALLAARWVMKADCIIVSMGPGIVGTGTKWGFTGIEQGQIINAVASLSGKAIAVPRVSFADPRPRHQGLSHHTITVLKDVALAPATVPFGFLEEWKMDLILKQWHKNKLDKHRLIIKEVDNYLAKLAKSKLNVKTMNRGLDQEREFFSCCLAAGLLAKEFLM